jgi:flagellar basal-body rod modification protein FlgD
MASGSVQGVGTSSSSPASSASGLGAINSADFMSLLLAQMKNQDPLQPMDDTQFMGQLIQLSTLNQVTEVSKNLATMLQIDRFNQAAGLVGKSVEGTDPSTGATVKGVVDAAEIVDDNASVVVGGKTLSLSEINKVAEDDGLKLLRITSLIGKEVEVSTGAQGDTAKELVSSVKMVDGSPVLVMSDGSTASQSDLVSVLDPGSTPLTQASALIGMQIEAISSAGTKVSGIAQRVETVDGGLQLTIDGTPVKVASITSVAENPNKK